MSESEKKARNDEEGKGSLLRHMHSQSGFHYNRYIRVVLRASCGQQLIDSGSSRNDAVLIWVLCGVCRAYGRCRWLLRLRQSNQILQRMRNGMSWAVVVVAVVW